MALHVVLEGRDALDSHWHGPHHCHCTPCRPCHCLLQHWWPPCADCWPASTGKALAHPWWWCLHGTIAASARVCHWLCHTSVRDDATVRVPCLCPFREAICNSQYCLAQVHILAAKPHVGGGDRGPCRPLLERRCLDGCATLGSCGRRCATGCGNSCCDSHRCRWQRPLARPLCHSTLAHYFEWLAGLVLALHDNTATGGARRDHGCSSGPAAECSQLDTALSIGQCAALAGRTGRL